MQYFSGEKENLYKHVKYMKLISLLEKYPWCMYKYMIIKILSFDFEAN